MWQRALVAVVAATLMFAVVRADPDAAINPDYSDDLKRQNVPVRFKLVDSKDRPIAAKVSGEWVSYGHPICAYLQRILGPEETNLKWTVPSFIDGEDIIGGTPDVPGLEPGTYRLDVRVGHYGRTQHVIEVGDEPVTATVRLPNSMRLIRIKYTDDAGDELAWVPEPPRFEGPRLDLFVHGRTNVPHGVLRLPPVTHQTGRPGGGAVGLGPGIGPLRQPQHRHLTDDGVILVPVFDGVEGKIIVPLREILFFEKERTLEPPFEDEIEIKLEVSQGYPIATARWPAVNEDDPGLKKLHSPVPSGADTERSFEHSVTLKASPTVRAWVRAARTKPAGSEQRSWPGHFDGERFWSDREGGTPRINGYSHRGGNFRVLPEEEAEHNSMIFTSRAFFRPIALDAEDGEIRGTFFRVLDADGQRIPFAEAVIMPLEEDEIASQMRELEVRLDEAVNRPVAPEYAPWRGNLMANLTPESTDEEVREAIGDEAWDALEKNEFRRRYARFSAWYDSFKRMDGDADGYVIAPHVRLEAGKRYVLYVWGSSRDDLKPDLRLVVEGQGSVTDFGVIQLP